MSSTTPYSDFICGTGLNNPEHVLMPMKSWMIVITAGQISTTAPFLVEFIAKASGIQLRFAIFKGVLLYIGRMRPRIQRLEEALSDKAEMTLHAVRETIKVAGKSPQASMQWLSPEPIHFSPKTW
jgi:hypothetical protein